jgi:acyl-CoA synthetase (AMP-forming)/AMP-acid ligase II
VQCLYTSGTTSRPKGALTSHIAAVFAGISVAHTLRLTEVDVGLASLPLHHVAGLNATATSHLLVGAALHLVPRWDAGETAAAVERLGVTNMMLSGPMWTELARRAQEDGRDLSSMRQCVVGMASLVPERAEELREVAPNAVIFLASGMTEFTSWQTAQHGDEARDKLLSWGSPTLMTEVRVMDPDGNLLPPNQTGEIVYRGPTAMNGYLGQPEATAEQCRDGWFRSGDLGYMDEDSTVWFVDRSKDMIKTGGENVASLEVSDVLFSHPAVEDCAVVGLPHERWSEAVTAFVKVRQGRSVTAEELTELCGAHLARFKVPKQIVFVDEFPRTGSGKIQKAKLREAHADLYAQASSA